MEPTYEEIEQSVATLSKSEKAKLAFQLLIEADKTDRFEDVQKAWEEELANRLHDIDSGKVPFRDAKLALAEARASLRK